MNGNQLALKIFFDGACKNEKDVNCPMGIGVAVYINDLYCEDLSISRLYVDYELDDGTNNIAEWLALQNALQVATDLVRLDKYDTVEIFGDSKIIVNQFNKQYRMSDEKFIKYFNQCTRLNQFVKATVSWIPRENNKKADFLSKQSLIEYKQQINQNN